MAEKIILNIPLEVLVLRETANFCNRLASALSDVKTPTKEEVVEKFKVPAPAEVPAPPVVAAVAPPVIVPAPVEAPAPVVPPAAVELDINGRAWDERIHASTKSKYQAGGWKIKRGVSPELVKQVEMELLSGMLPPAPPATGMTYAELLSAITANGIPNEEVLDVLAEFEISSLALLAAKPDMIPAFAEKLLNGE